MKRRVLLMWALLALACNFGTPFALRESGVPSAIQTADANEVRSRPSERPDRARESERKAGDVRANRTEASDARSSGSFREQRQLPESFKRSDLFKWEYGEFDGRTLRNSVPSRPDVDTIRDHLRQRAKLDGVDGGRTSLSMYSDLPTAERATAESLRRNKAEIDAWLSQGGEAQRSFSSRFESSIGVQMDVATGAFSKANRSTVILRRTSDGRFSLVESYPETVRPADAEETLKGESAQRIPGGGLGAHERAGGHLLAEHVGKSDAYLASRLARDPRLRAASTFINRAEAESAISTVLTARATIIDAWVANGAHGRLVIDTRFNGGAVLQRGAITSSPGNGVRAVLVGDSAGTWRILTGYPTP